ncbi:hypothetical protein GCM10029992_08700 [Glycomyces albus]
MTGGPQEGDAPPGLEDLDHARAYDGVTVEGTCGHDDCNIPPKTDAETAWEELMAPIPVGGIRMRAPNEPNSYFYPDQGTFEHVLSAIRPGGADSDNYAMRTISSAWKHVSETQLQAIYDDLDIAIKNLANSWEGDDFDGLSDTMDETLQMITNTQGKIDTLVTDLDEVADTVEQRQGLQSGDTPFPPAQLYMKEADCCDGYKVHIRPPWGTDCERFEGSYEIADALAAEGGVIVEETREFINNRTDELVDSGMSQEEAETQAREEAMYEIEGSRDEQLQAYVDTTNDEIADIKSRRTEADMAVEAMNTGARPETPPDIADEEEIEPSPGPGAPPAGGAPSVSGLDGFGNNTPGASPSMPDLGGGSGGSGSYGGGTGGLPGYDPNNPGGSGGLDDDNPWGGGLDDPDDIGVVWPAAAAVSALPGLGTGGGPGGLGTGAGAGAGAGAGGIGGMMGAGGAGAGRGAGAAGGRGAGRGAGGGMRGGAGAGAGAGRGAGGRGMTGMMGGGAGGRPGMGAGEGEGGDDTWLTEDDDVWGIGNEDDDPYA